MLLIYFLYIIKPIWLNAALIEWRFFRPDFSITISLFPALFPKFPYSFLIG
ncbi:hypothetical protein OQ038_1275 [Haemophilus influenzae]|nr:hypothetical protein BV189_1277 [Haemophilus influenzae]WCN74924.1 hypothetical protein BV187_1272 [Haemophilus influenzae]WCO84326.1 hypothetical protein OQ038_1275 [Haemophilus influenzae]WCO86022.1 hypothetical protein OQ039_1273 [Haemophilus influenzae]